MRVRVWEHEHRMLAPMTRQANSADMHIGGSTWACRVFGSVPHPNPLPHCVVARGLFPSTHCLRSGQVNAGTYCLGCVLKNSHMASVASTSLLVMRGGIVEPGQEWPLPWSV